jgi:hypothetical protein
VTCGKSVVFSANKTDRHDIFEILLKVALNTIDQKTTTIIIFDILAEQKYFCVQDLHMDSTISTI